MTDRIIHISKSPSQRELSLTPHRASLSFSFVLSVLTVFMIFISSVSVMAASHSTKLNGTNYNRVYDYNYYTEYVHPELRGRSDEAVLSYFVNTGMAKGEQAISSFDPKSYRRGNQSFRLRYGKDWKKYYMHFQTTGYKNSWCVKTAVGLKTFTKPVTVYDGVDYKSVYDYHYYIKRYPGVGRAYPDEDVKVLQHFVKWGIPQQKTGSSKFSVKSYRYANPEIRMNFKSDYRSMVLYYISHPNKFGGATGVTKLQKPITSYKGVDLKKVFDYTWYTRANSSVVGKYGVDAENDDASAIEHFAKIGIFQGRTGKRGIKNNHPDYKAAIAALRKKIPSIGTEETILADRYASDTPYLILLNQSKHMVYIFKGKQGDWVKIKSFPCCTGKPSTPTPTGIYKSKDRGLYFWSGSCRCWYWTRIVGGIMFHSQIYDGSSSPSYLVDGSMGVSCSHGCVRLHLSNAKWIYDNIPRDTKIVSYR